jgi:hypothetical protein
MQKNPYIITGAIAVLVVVAALAVLGLMSALAGQQSGLDRAQASQCPTALTCD